MTATRAKCPNCQATYVYQNRDIATVARDPIRSICQKCRTRMDLSATGEPLPGSATDAGKPPAIEHLPRVRRLTVEQDTDARRLVLSALGE